MNACKAEVEELKEKVAALALENEDKVYAVFNDPGDKFAWIDLIGLTQERAIQRTKDILAEIKAGLEDKSLEPNFESYHIFKVAAHAGKHSEKDKGPKLKFAILEMLKEEGYFIHEDIENGTYLVRFDA